MIEDGAAVVREGRFECVRGSPPGPGDRLCRLLTGRTEAELVSDIFAGLYADFFTASTAEEAAG